MSIQEMLNTLIGTLVGAGLALGSSFYLYKHKQNVAVEGSATILYSDIEEAINTLEMAKSIQDLEGSVLSNGHSSLVDRGNFRNLIIDLRNKLSSKHIKDLIIFYNNLGLLENYRVEYWSAESDIQARELNLKYTNTLTLVCTQIDQQKFKDAFEAVKKCSAFKKDE